MRTMTLPNINLPKFKSELTQFLGRSELAQVLASFKREFIWVGLFSLLINLLMLTPTLYMLQIFDRVMISRNELTLLFLTLIVLGLY